ncbi:hypothetical protein ACA910_015717 [Epithemia clementina (nom. ined.)]
MTKVNFQLPTPEELHWERTRRGFFARERHKLRKAGKLKMRKIKVEVEVEDYHDIDKFIDDVIKKIADDPEKGKFFINKTRPDSLQLGDSGDWLRTMSDLKTSYRINPEKDVAVSKWLQEALKEGDYPFVDSKDETDAVAIAGVNKKPAEHDEDGDLYFDEA